VAGDDSAFHTRGLYLRAVEQAIQEAGLKDDPDVIENLSRLSEHYAQTPRGSQISLVQQTVNKRLAIAPRDPIERPPSRIGAFGAVILIISLVVIVMGVSMFAK
jgi:hypothetical protein